MTTATALPPLVKRLSLISAAMLFGAGLGWIALPSTLVDLFGVPLADESHAYATLKGMEDILPALLVGLFVIQNNRRALRTSLYVMLLLPMVDSTLVVIEKGLTTALLMQLPYVLVPLAAARLLGESARVPSAAGAVSG
ncbi:MULTISPECIES: DUF4267 domain-containing protein [Streptomyces]|uniref:DUF4267 domain-containing protein n=2 Tax=Streptomyces TaxID=1883 RepID=A0ABV9IRM1_9ACTN